jgi:hypothetical protein
MNQFRRLQKGRGTEEVQQGGDNSTNVQAGGDVHFFDIRTASQRARERVEAERVAPPVGEYIRSIKLTRRPNPIEAFGNAFSASLAPAMGPVVEQPAKVPTPPRRTVGDWWARVRTDLGVLPFYNVDWYALAAQAFDLAALDDESSWELVEEYGQKIALLKETLEAGDLYPPQA